MNTIFTFVMYDLNRCRSRFALKNVMLDLQKNKKDSTNVASAVQNAKVELISTAQVNNPDMQNNFSFLFIYQM